MGDVVNLNRYRKSRNRAEAERKAEENRVKFGRTKAEKDRASQEIARLGKDLDGKELE